TSAGGRCDFASFVSTAWLSLFDFATIFLSATKRLEVAHQLAEHDGIEPAEHQVATSFPPAAAALDGDLAERLLRILRHHADDDARVERQLRLRAVGQRLFEPPDETGVLRRTAPPTTGLEPQHLAGRYLDADEALELFRVLLGRGDRVRLAPELLERLQ